MNTIIVFLPIIVLIVLAIKTKNMAAAMITAAILAALFYYKENIITGLVERMYMTLADSSYQFALFMLVGFGGMIKLFQESGGLSGFGDFVSKFATGQKRPMVLAWLMAMVTFVDDYLNVLTVTFSMKDITDRNGIPREHLALQANSVASCLCVLVPFSSWSAFNIGLLNAQGLGFNNYAGAIPYMFYAFITVILCLLLAIGVIPKVGTLKSSYQRVADGGPTFQVEEGSKSLVDLEMSGEQKSTSALNVIIPIIVLVAGVMIFDHNLIIGITLAVAVQFLMYIVQKIMTVGEFLDNFFEGAKSMSTLAIVIFFGFMLTSINEDMGFFDILVGGISASLPGWLLPAVTFLIVGFATFATAGCLVMQLISIPLFVPLALAAGVPVEPVIAAIMCGVNMGYGCCFYADSVFMASAGTGVSNLRIIKTTAPYAIAVIILTAIAFLITGIIIV